MTNSEPAGERSVKGGRLRLLSALAWGAAVGGAGVVLVALLWRDGLGEAPDGWIAAHLLAFMCATFAYHAGVAMVPVALVAVIARRRRLLAASAAVFALGAGPELLVALPPLGTQEGGSPTLKIMSANLMYGYTDAAKLLAQIERERPDVVVFQEWTPRSAAELGPRLREVFPHVVEHGREDAFGQAVVSRRPFVSPSRAYPPAGSFAEPQITVEVEHEGRPMAITNVHLLPPIGVAYHREQRRGARALGEWAGRGTAGGAPDVMIGDFNAVRGSSIIRALTRAGMREGHAEAGRWRGTTWPRRGRLRHAPGVRIDQALTGPRVRCVAARTGEDFGSDHRSVIVEVAWAEDEPPASQGAQPHDTGVQRRSAP